ncbi:MAG TPA: hypothetical protein VGC20_13555 [bacterium]
MNESQQLTTNFEPPFEMANLRPKNTGLPMVIWVSEKGRARHGPRIKVSRQHGSKMDALNTVSVTIDNEPRVVGGELPARDLDALKRYIALNIEPLLGFWNGELDTVELVARLRQI